LFSQLIVDGFELVLVAFDFHQVRFGRFNKRSLVGDRFYQAVDQPPDFPGRDASIVVSSGRGLDARESWDSVAIAEAACLFVRGAVVDSRFSDTWAVAVPCDFV
jgi:hypothetical protein